MISKDEIVELIEKGTPDWLKEAQEDFSKLNAQVNGVGVADRFSKIEGHENQTQYDLRKKFSKSAKHIYGNLLRPTDKIFTAAGGSKIITGKNSEKSPELLKEKTESIRHGYSLRKWIQKVQWNKFMVDPAGMTFFEWDKEKTYPTIKGSTILYNYKAEGREVEWVLFAPVKSKDQPGEEYWRYVDSEQDVTWIVKENDPKTARQDEEKTYAVPFDKCPAIINSDIINHDLKRVTTPLHNVMEIGEKYMRSDSVKDIYEYLHGYPIFWFYVNLRDVCTACTGSGTVVNHANGGSTSVCSNCRGEGKIYKKDITDGIGLKPPPTKDAPTITPDVAGYVSPDLETWREMRTELEWMTDAMFFTMWGTRYEHGKNETATARFLDVQPVQDALHALADSAEDMETRMLWFVSDFYDLKIEAISVNYGRRYMMESPDSLLTKYRDLREKGAPVAMLDHTLIQYYQTEFMNDPQMLHYMINALKLEPLTHWTLEQAEKYSQDLFQVKIKFTEWFKTKSIQEVTEGNLDKLKEELKNHDIKMVQEPVSGSSPEETTEEDNAKKQAQATLKGSVGGVQGILSIQQAVTSRQSSPGAAATTLREIYGFSDEIITELLTQIK